MQATQKRTSEPLTPKRKVGRPRGSVQRPEPPKGSAVPCTVTSASIRAIESRMTAKQIKFARIIANVQYPVSQREAYRQVYDYACDPSGSALHTMSVEVAAHPMVRQLVDEIKAETGRVNSAIWSDRERMRLQLGANFLRYAELAEAAGDLKTAVAATKAAGETIMVRLFAKAEPDEATQAAGDLAGELLSKLRNLVAERPATVDLMPQIEGESDTSE